MSDFQKLLSSLGQRSSIVPHIDLSSVYIRQWQVKLAHTRFNPHDYSSLFIPHCVVIMQNLTTTQIPSTQRNSWKESSTAQMCSFLSQQHRHRRHTMALQCNTHTWLYYGTFLYCYTVQNLCFHFWLSHTLPFYSPCMYEFGLQDYIK